MSIARTLATLRKNNMEAAFVPTAQDVVPLLMTMLEEGNSIALGGSVTLVETGALKHVKSGAYRLIDRYEASLTPEQRIERYKEAFSADVFLTSVNAITEHGELYLVDGTSNRVAPMLFGPKKVIIIAGWQKIVPSLREAVDRVKQIAGPANAMRLSKDTPCVRSGKCIAPHCDDRNLMAIPTGTCDTGICSNMVVMGHQTIPGRISVLIVGEELGY